MLTPRQLTLFLVATQFLTRLPVRAIPGFRQTWLAGSELYFPLVGALVGYINVGVWWLSGHWFPPGVSVALMMAIGLLVTGSFHEDGFADTCDGFGCGGSTEQVLAIMKDSRIGAYGAIGIAMSLGLKWSILVALPTTSFPVIVVGAQMMSRWCASGLIWSLRYLRLGDTGKCTSVSGALSRTSWVLSGVIGLAGLLPAMLSQGLVLRGSTIQTCVGAIMAAIATTVVTARYFKKSIGGYTGDCLGAVQQLSELTFLLAASAGQS